MGQHRNEVTPPECTPAIAVRGGLHVSSRNHLADVRREIKVTMYRVFYTLTRPLLPFFAPPFPVAFSPRNS
jgi:hypothetical protein